MFLYAFSPLALSFLWFLVFLSARCLHVWFAVVVTVKIRDDKSSAFLPDLVIPYDESVLGASSPSHPVTSRPISSREDLELFKQNI